jgi:hypothetical protein
MFHSRITVTGEMCSASAVSSTLSPPKIRASTTLTFPQIDGRQPLQHFVERDQVSASFL